MTAGNHVIVITDCLTVLSFLLDSSEKKIINRSLLQDLCTGASVIFHICLSLLENVVTSRATDRFLNDECLVLRQYDDVNN